MLSRAISLCHSENARLGVAFTRPKVEMFAPAWPGACVLPAIQGDVSRDVLAAIPQEIALRHLIWEHQIRTAGLITIAERLGCDAVLLAKGSHRCQRALRRAGLTVLVEPGKARIPAWRSPRPVAAAPAPAPAVAMLPAVSN